MAAILGLVGALVLFFGCGLFAFCCVDKVIAKGCFACIGILGICLFALVGGLMYVAQDGIAKGLDAACDDTVSIPNSEKIEVFRDLMKGIYDTAEDFWGTTACEMKTTTWEGFSDFGYVTDDEGAIGVQFCDPDIMEAIFDEMGLSSIFGDEAEAYTAEEQGEYEDEYGDEIDDGTQTPIQNTK